MPPRSLPSTLAHWPWVVVRVACAVCRRRGCYRLARLAAKYGPDQSVDGLLRDLSQDCPWYDERARRDGMLCGARFPDLDEHPSPPDHPDVPLFRQRQPAREDLPKPSRPAVVSRHGRSLPTSLAAWPTDRIGFHCPRCLRRESFAVATLAAAHRDAPLTHVLRVMTMDCPRRNAGTIREVCGALFVWPDDKSGD